MATSATQSRSNMLTVTLVAALVVPRIQRWLGITLTNDDIAMMIAGVPAVWHAAITTFVRYFPPPTQPAEPAKVP